MAGDRACSWAPARCSRPPRSTRPSTPAPPSSCRPGFDPRSSSGAGSPAVPVLPGVATASEIMRAAGPGRGHGEALPRRGLLGGPAGGAARSRRRSPACASCPPAASDAEQLPAYLSLPAVPRSVAPGWRLRDLVARGPLGRGRPAGARRARSDTDEEAAMTALEHPPRRASAATTWSSLGEVMLRLDPGEGRIRTARSFRAWEGGGEYNVARGLRRCFGLRTGDRHRARRQRGRPPGRGPDPAGRRRHRATSGGCRTTASAAPSATGSTSPSAASACAAPSASPTAATPPRASCGPATSTGTPLRRRRACAGSTPAASSPRCPRPRREVVDEAMAAARRHGTVVSYDLNYRPSLWKRHRRAGAARRR